MTGSIGTCREVCNSNDKVAVWQVYAYQGVEPCQTFTSQFSMPRSREHFACPCLLEDERFADGFGHRFARKINTACAEFSQHALYIFTKPLSPPQDLLSSMLSVALNDLTTQFWSVFAQDDAVNTELL